MFDPILNVEQNRAYTEIGTIGNIDYAPIALPPAAPDVDYDNNAILLTNEQFLTNRPRPEGVGLGRPLEGAVHVGKAPPGPAR